MALAWNNSTSFLEVNTIFVFVFVFVLEDTIYFFTCNISNGAAEASNKGADDLWQM